jgi:predicted esterase
LQNESDLPKDFAREVRDLIRTLDPTSPTWRLTTTCNGGKGSDWNVPQEWSGTYGGNCNDYDLERLQLVGEYGAWRAFGVHTECDYRGDENDRSESWACYAMETKIRLGEVSRERAVGHFHWVFNSFPNPGRTAENYEGPGNGQIGSLNNKGLVTAWNQPSDLFYLFRANYADPLRDPMVYIVSHTWPDRWTSGPRPRRVEVYSNCDEVELFNGFRKRSLGIRQQPGRGRHFVWEGVAPEFGILHAVGRTGASVAEDLIARKVTSPERLGIKGGSNGGLLVGNLYAMRPELFGAVLCQVPLLDMRRFNKLLAGASWMGEYGNPDLPEEWAFIKTFSPYHTVAADRDYPPLLITTSTRDDRVHPGHARKMTARLAEFGKHVVYYENIEGGHGGAADNKQRAFMDALGWMFLERELSR